MVIAVVAVLATLFFLPALGRARQQAQAVQCLNNLRRLTLGWLMFNADNKGFLPGNGDEGNQPGTLASTADPQWCPGRMDTGAPVGQPTNTAWLKIGQIYPYVGSPVFYRCPADTSTYKPGTVYPLGGPGNPRVRSVSMNCWMNPPADNAVGMDVGHYRAYRQDGDMAVPGSANLWVFLDENPWSINDGFMWEEPLGVGASGVFPVGNDWTDIPATYHRGAGGISFGDGHAQMRKWTGPNVI